MSQRIKDIIVSSVISIAITIVFGYYFLYIGREHREPTFYVDPVRTTVIDQHNVEGAPLLLLRSNGDTISSDVVSVYFYFFNQGKETIKAENIYAPLKLRIDGATILDYKILKTSRAVSGASLVLDSVSNNLVIGFRALEKNDGIAGQIIFEGNKDATLALEGGIDGVTEFATELNAIPPIYFLIAIFLFLISAYIFLIMNKRTPRSVPKLLFFFSALPVIYLLLMFYKSEWFVHHKVPQSLRSEQYIEKQEQEILDLPAWLE